MSVRLGELLTKASLITQDQLKEALRVQKETGGKLGETLIKLGFVSEEDITECLSQQFGVPSINLQHFEIDSSVIKLIPGDVVAVIASFQPFELNTFEPSDLAPGEVIDPSEIFLGTSGEGDGEGSGVRSPNSTGLILHNVLVTAVQVEQLPRTATEDLPDDAPALAPTGNLLITLAAPAEAVERIVFTSASVSSSAWVLVKKRPPLTCAVFWSSAFATASVAKPTV